VQSDGEDKPIMFHDQQWAEKLAAKENNSIIAFESDHWVMVREPERFNKVVSEWFGILDNQNI
tara:strand:+ start:3831 stop:4019 length:189 start_codon:yes stop_codon:yes gene_type:complete